jgi:hypothetical protein
VNSLTHLKLGLATAGFITFGYGARIDNATVRWVGIALFIAAFLVRFLGPRPEKP